MDSAMVLDMVLGVVRHLATAAGGSLVADGLLMQSQINDFVGAVLFLAGLCFSVYVKYSARPAKKGA